MLPRRFHLGICSDTRFRSESVRQRWPSASGIGREKFCFVLLPRFGLKLFYLCFEQFIKSICSWFNYIITIFSWVWTLDSTKILLLSLIDREKVRTMKITTSKTKKNSENSVDDQNIEKIYKSDQNIKIQKDQNIESDLPMAFCLLNLT